MRIINRCMDSLILIKYYVMLIIGLNLLIIIEYVMCCLYKLCFDAWKNGYLNYKNYCFFKQRVNSRKNCFIFF
jgi:hypothetical protein